MKRILIIGLALIAMPFATPAFGQAVTATLPTTCPPSGVNCVRAQPVVNPDGTNVGGAGGPSASQLPATLGPKTGANSLSVVPNTDTAFPISAAALPLPAGSATSAKQDTMIANQTATGASAQNVQGSSADSATDAGNPVKTGCVYMTTAPTYTNGQRTSCQSGLRGASIVQLVRPDTSTPVGVLATLGSFSNATVPLVTAAAGALYNSTTWDPARSINGSDGTGSGVAAIATAPQSASAGAITPVVGSLVSSINAKGSAGNLYAVSITTGAVAGYLYVFNSTTLPADGAVTAGTASGNYQICTAVSATTTVTQSFDIPERFSVGIRPVFSTTACGTLTNSTTAVFLKSRAQ